MQSEGTPVDVVSEEKAKRATGRCCFIRKVAGGYDSLGWWVDVSSSFDLTVQYIPAIPKIITPWTDSEANDTCLYIDEAYHDIVTVYTAILGLSPDGVNVQTYQGLYADFKETLIISVNPSNLDDRTVVDVDGWYE